MGRRQPGTRQRLGRLRRHALHAGANPALNSTHEEMAKVMLQQNHPTYTTTIVLLEHVLAEAETTWLLVKAPAQPTKSCVLHTRSVLRTKRALTARDAGACDGRQQGGHETPQVPLHAGFHFGDEWWAQGRGHAM